MLKHLLLTLSFLCAIPFAWSQTEAPAALATPTAMADDVEEVLVMGEQPGPGLWKVYKGDHVLWIMGNLSPLPKGMQWRATQVETALSQSQLFLMQPRVKLEVGFWSKIGMLPALIGVKNNPNGETLSDVLPADLYARWSVLKEKYIGKDSSIEKQRPIFAAVELFKKSIEKSGMVPSDFVRWHIEQIVRDHKIATYQPELDHQLKNPRATIKKFKKSSLDDVECFAKTIERLETDLDAMRARANAWATGDINALRQLPYPDNVGACTAVVTGSQLAQDEGLADVETQMAALWIAAAEDAIAKNTSTFAMLPMAELLKPNGYVAQLKARGYQVEAD